MIDAGTKIKTLTIVSEMAISINDSDMSDDSEMSDGSKMSKK